MWQGLPDFVEVVEDLCEVSFAKARVDCPAMSCVGVGYSRSLSPPIFLSLSPSLGQYSIHMICEGGGRRPPPRLRTSQAKAGVDCPEMSCVGVWYPSTRNPEPSQRPHLFDTERPFLPSQLLSAEIIYVWFASPPPLNAHSSPSPRPTLTPRP